MMWYDLMKCKWTQIESKSLSRNHRIANIQFERNLAQQTVVFKSLKKVLKLFHLPR